MESTLFFEKCRKYGTHFLTFWNAMPRADSRVPQGRSARRAQRPRARATSHRGAAWAAPSSDAVFPSAGAAMSDVDWNNLKKLPAALRKGYGAWDCDKNELIAPEREVRRTRVRRCRRLPVRCRAWRGVRRPAVEHARVHARAPTRGDEGFGHRLERLSLIVLVLTLSCTHHACTQCYVFEEIPNMDYPWEGMPTIPPHKDREHLTFFTEKDKRFRVRANPDEDVADVKRRMFDGGMNARANPGTHFETIDDVVLWYAGQTMRDGHKFSEYRVPPGCQAIMAKHKKWMDLKQPPPDDDYWL